MSDEGLLPNSLGSPFQYEIWHVDGSRFYRIPKGTILAPGESRLITFEERVLLVDEGALDAFRCSSLRAIGAMMLVGIWVAYALPRAIIRTLLRGESVTVVSGDLLTRTAPPTPPAPEPQPARSAPDPDQLADLNRLIQMGQSILDQHGPADEADAPDPPGDPQQG